MCSGIQNYCWILEGGIGHILFITSTRPVGSGKASRKLHGIVSPGKYLKVHTEIKVQVK